MAELRASEAMLSTNPAQEWFKYWNGYLDRADDPRFRATWERAIKVGQRVAIERTANWSGLVPVLQDVLDYLIDTAIERDMEAVSLTGVDGNSEAHGAASAGPDPTVADDLQVGN